MPNTPAGASLTNDQVLSQDAYGSDTERDHRRRRPCRCPTSPSAGW